MIAEYNPTRKQKLSNPELRANVVAEGTNMWLVDIDPCLDTLVPHQENIVCANQDIRTDL